MRHTIEALTAETAPLSVNGPKAEPELTGQYTEWPEPLRSALRSLAIEQHDSGTCEVCGAAVGYTLGGDADEIETWHWATAVHLDDGETFLLCEECEQVLHVIGASA